MQNVSTIHRPRGLARRMFETLEERRVLASIDVSVAYGAFVDSAYQHVLARSVDAIALSAWAQQPDLAGIRVPLATALVQSDEYFARLVGQDYEQILNRAPDSAGLKFWTAQLNTGVNDELIEAGLLASAEYGDRAGPTDSDWVSSLYQDELGRTADAQGLAAWLKLLTGGGSYFDVARQVLASPERERQRVAADFQHYLGRNADAAALDYFAAQLSHGSPQTDLVSALVASSEFFTRSTGQPASVVATPTASDLALSPGIRAQASQGDAEVLFLGDSLTWAWQNIGETVWNQYYAPLHALNAGVPGDRTENLLWRIQQGELTGAHPKLVILQIGTNNVDTDSASDIATGVSAVVAALEQQLPDAKILVLGILPRAADPTDRTRQSAASANELVRGIADNSQIFYSDPSPSFLRTDGSLATDLYLSDNKHLSASGYQVLRAALAEEIDMLLKG